MGVRIVEPVPWLARARGEGIERLRGIYHARGRMTFRRRLEALPPPPAGIRPNFGWIDAPAREAETRIGGGVKLVHLRERFGEYRRDFNLLYLVSSLLHLIPHAEELVAWAKRRGIPVIWNQNGVAYPAWCGAGYPWFNEPMRRLIHRADHVIYQSDFCRASADRYLGAVTAGAEVRWNPVDIGHFSPAPAPPSLGTWELLAMGTSHAFYRVKSSLDVLAALRRRGADARLTIAGELRWAGGPEEVNRYLDQMDLRDRVRLLPRFTQDEAPARYRAAHVVLHPKYKDPCPTVPIEAMACGVPVIGSESGGMPELIGPDAGRLVPVPDDWTRDHAPSAEAAADAVQAVMAGHAEFSRAARGRAERFFDRDRWVDRHAEIFELYRSR
jgi:glycosyltransferase involved in cell wall biosynthesis